MKLTMILRLVAVLVVFVIVPMAGAQVEPSPLTVLKQQEMALSGSKGDVSLGRVMTLTYPAYRVSAAETYIPDLIELAKALNSGHRKNYAIVLRGYTDNSGPPEGNLRISRSRAESLQKLLVMHPDMAISQDRIIAEGLGNADPIASNDTVEGRQQNRRVEIHIYTSMAAVEVLSEEAAIARADPEKPAPGTAVTGPRPLPSPEPAMVRLTLMDAIQYGLEGNQDIQVVSFTPQASREELSGAESVFDTEVFADGSFRRDPNLQSSVTNIVTEDGGLVETGIRKPLGSGGSIATSLEMRYGNLNNADFDRVFRYTFAPTLEFRQPLLKNVGARQQYSAIKIANYQVNISEEEFRQEVLEIVARVARAYWQLFLFGEFVNIDRENFKMAEEVYRRESVRVREGISQQLDVERARSNAQRRRGNLVNSNERLRVAADQLKLLLNWSNLTIDSAVDIIPIDTPETIVKMVDEQESIEKALLHRPEIGRARQRLEIRKVEEKLSRHLRLPNLDVFGRYAVTGYGREFSDSFNNTGFDDNDVWSAGLNFAYPFGNRSAQARYRKSAIERNQASAQIERVQNQIKQDVKEVLLAIRFAKGEIESTRVAKVSAEKVVEGEFIRFEIGQTTNEELLRAQDLLAANSRSFARAVVNYNVALAELARAQGILPDGVSIDGPKWAPQARE